jgi:hypothetical protein
MDVSGLVVPALLARRQAAHQQQSKHEPCLKRPCQRQVQLPEPPPFQGTSAFGGLRNSHM